MAHPQVAALIIAASSTTAPATAWRDAASRWEVRAEVCLQHLQVAQADVRRADALRPVVAPEVRRPWGWWAGGAAGGLALGVAATSCVERPCQPLGLIGAAALAALAIGLTVAF